MVTARGRAIVGWAVPVALVLLGWGPARADDPSSGARARADESFRQAKAAFARGEFAAAAAAFEQAATFVLHPAPLMNAAEAWENAGEPVRAIEDCDRVSAIPDAGEQYR